MCVWIAWKDGEPVMGLDLAFPLLPVRSGQIFLSWTVIQRCYGLSAGQEMEPVLVYRDPGLPSLSPVLRPRAVHA